MKFLANENFPAGSIKLLRNAGHDVSSVIENSPGATDIVVLKQAFEEKRIVLTFDRDYGELIFRHKQFTSCGIMYFRFDPAHPEEPANLLLQILQQPGVSVSEKYTVVERDRIRQRNTQRE